MQTSESFIKKHMNEIKKYAPVAIFVYNRLDNTKQVVEALRQNYLAKETEVFVFSDGPKNEHYQKGVQAVRDYLKTVDGFKSFTVIERPSNYYIERNITEGVTDIVNKYGRIIVLEDDGVSAKHFLTFINKALDFYEDKKRIMHIGTFTFIKIPDNYRKTIIWRYVENTGGGWATWKDRWDKFKWFQSEDEGLKMLTPEQKSRIEMEGDFKCLGSLKLNPIPWDICWYIALTHNDGLAVNSPGSIIKNNGLFNGTHFTALNRLLGKHPFDVNLDEDENIVFEDKMEENPVAISLLKDLYRKMGKRKRDKILHYFVRFLVLIGVTKILKKIFR